MSLLRPEPLQQLARLLFDNTRSDIHWDCRMKLAHDCQQAEIEDASERNPNPDSPTAKLA